MILDEDHRVSGVLDWTETHAGDPGLDFIFWFATLGASALSALIDRYSRAGGRTWSGMHDHIARMWSAYPVVIAEFYQSAGEASHRALAQSLVDATARQLSASRASLRSEQPAP